ncbi:hypothetical protein [Paenibacillus fonticola]|uniref:hypothetical protein n=1 Tax=Paenibacillus fonticola TaxID=379896 RepID=UPI00037F76D2|nr:hypothetical protein [Paenibacillus fonticola]
MNSHRAFAPFSPFFPSPGGGPGAGLPPGVTPPPPQLLGTFQQLSQSPALAQNFVFQQPAQGAVSFAAGCQNRWTLIVTRTFNVFLMFVTSTNPFGFTQGFIFPTYSFGSFPSSVILWYTCF